MHAIEISKQYREIKECNHRMDWWIVAFRFCYNQSNDIWFFKYLGIINSLDWREDGQFLYIKDIEKEMILFKSKLMSYI